MIPGVTQEDSNKMISEGIFCNTQCGRQKLSKVVIDILNPELLKTLLRVFEDLSTQIGHQNNIIDCCGRSSPRPRTDSVENDIRRELIPNIDDSVIGDREEEEEVLEDNCREDIYREKEE